MTDYERYYPQLVDTEEPLSVISQKDFKFMHDWDLLYPLMSHLPKDGRIDHFDVSYGAHPMQKLDIHYIRGDKPAPVLIYIHGGGWNGGDKSFSRFYAPLLTEDGYVFVSINYRLAPADVFPAQIEDCALALKWVIGNISRYGGNPKNIGIFGDSAGGHLAALTVTGQKWHKKYGVDVENIKCWIPISGIHDLHMKENYYNKGLESLIKSFVNENLVDDASPVSHISGDEPPCLIIHGADDWIVPRTNSIVFYNKLKDKGVNAALKLIKGYWHINMTVKFGQKDHIATHYIRRFLRTYLYK